VSYEKGAIDESNYVELELRRDDYWAKTNSTTRVVATLALQNPIFHYNGVFDAAIAIRNLYIEESDLGLKKLSVWAGSRMYRGDDAYLLDFWPLDNLNTLGGGVRYEANEGRTQVALHAGTNQPNNGFFKQSVERELPFNQLGATTVDVLNRQRFIGSARLQHVFKVGHAGGIKLVGYGEGHALPAGQREIRPETFQDVEEEAGFVVGGQVGGFTGERSTHVNLFVRYASGLAAFGELGTPNQLGLDKSSAGASELTATFTGNFEAGPFALMAAGYVRSFRNASPDLDYGDLDEAIIMGRPHLFFGEWGGLALEASYQVLQRGVLAMGAPGSEGAPRGPATGSLFRFGVVPFLSPSGRGSYARPHIRFIYLLTARDEGARAFYPQDDTSSLRDLDHFFGFGAEWWFNSARRTEASDDPPPPRARSALPRPRPLEPGHRLHEVRRGPRGRDRALDARRRLARRGHLPAARRPLRRRRRGQQHRVDLTAPGKWHGGDWRGLEDKLGYLENLGVTTLWISPGGEERRHRRRLRRLPRLLGAGPGRDEPPLR
jgi:hypothetical protein